LLPCAAMHTFLLSSCALTHAATFHQLALDIYSHTRLATSARPCTTSFVCCLQLLSPAGCAFLLQLKMLISDLRDRLPISISDIRHYITAPGGFHTHCMDRTTMEG
jgi:hypothetical protein